MPAPRRLLPLLLLLSVAGRAHAGDGSLVWKTVETDHFVVTYYEPLDDMAHRIAVVAERAHRVLAPMFEHEPTEKTYIVLVDDNDSANGFANVAPRNSIRLYASAPTALSVLNDHDDWMYGLVAHEYTHVLHLDTIGGLPKLYNKIFGKIWAPNQIQPRWAIEGIATYEESKQSSSGRTRSALFDMFLRVAVLGGEELDLDAVTAGPRAWPHGTAAYLYGGHFLKYVFDRYGDDKVADWSKAYGSNPIPFGVNLSISRAVGKPFTELYDEWSEYMRQKYGAKLESIERRGRIEGRRLTFQGEANSNPQYSADGRWIVWDQADGRSAGRLRKMPSGGNVADAVDLFDSDRAGSFDVLSNGDVLLEQTRTTRTFYDTQDLVLWDSATGEFRELTAGVRARDPQASPDERRIAFVLNGQGRSRIAVMKNQPEARYEVVWAGPDRYDQASAPSWSPDGKRIAFSGWTKGGYRDIYTVDADSGDAVAITHDRAIDADPVYSPDGKYLYYSSDRNGIFNIYAYDFAADETWQVTNVVGCATVPDVSPDGKRMIYRGYDVDGYELYELDLDPATWIEPELYVDDRPDSTVVPDDEVIVSAPRAYRPLETLAPQSYELQYITDSFGDAVNITTYGSDIAGWHGYNLGATYGLTRGDVSVGGSYSYRRLWAGLRIAANRSVARRSGYFIDDENTRYVETNYGASVRLDLPVLRLPRGAANLSLDYDVDWFVNDEDEFDHYDPNQPVPTEPETDVVVSGVGLSWRYSDTRGYNWTVGEQDGESFTASVRLDHPSLGSDFHALSLAYRWQTYYRLPWGETPVLAVRLAGGLSTTDRRRSGLFVLGGVPEQDITRSVRDSLRSSSSGYLRGYPPRSVFGNQFHLLNLEYRQKIAEIERGFETLPFYVRRIHFAGLLDVGNAFFDGFDAEDFKVSAGGSLRLDVVFGYFEPGTIDIGYARGLTDDGLSEYWLLLTGTL